MTRRGILAGTAVLAASGEAQADPTRAEAPVTAVFVLRVKPGREAEFLELLAPVLDVMTP